MNPAETYPAVCTLWAHGKARVRLDDGRELPAVAANRIRGQVVPGTKVRVVLSGDATIARIVERVDDQPPERLKASERRRQRALGDGQ